MQVQYTQPIRVNYVEYRQWYLSITKRDPWEFKWQMPGVSVVRHNDKPLIKIIIPMTAEVNKENNVTEEETRTYTNIGQQANDNIEAIVASVMTPEVREGLRLHLEQIEKREKSQLIGAYIGNVLSNMMKADMYISWEKYNIQRIATNRGVYNKYTPINRVQNATVIHGSEMRTAKSNNTPGAEKAYFISINGINVICELSYVSPKQRDTSRVVSIKIGKQNEPKRLGSVKNAATFERTWLAKGENPKHYYRFIGLAITHYATEMAKDPERVLALAQNNNEIDDDVKFVSVKLTPEQERALEQKRMVEKAEQKIQVGMELGEVIYASYYEAEYMAARTSEYHPAYYYRPGDGRVVVDDTIVNNLVTRRITDALGVYVAKETKYTSEGIGMVKALHLAMARSHMSCPPFPVLLQILIDTVTANAKNMKVDKMPQRIIPAEPERLPEIPYNATAEDTAKWHKPYHEVINAPAPPVKEKEAEPTVDIEEVALEYTKQQQEWRQNRPSDPAKPLSEEEWNKNNEQKQEDKEEIVEVKTKKIEEEARTLRSIERQIRMLGGLK